MRVAVLYNLPGEQSDRSEKELIAEIEVLEEVKAVRESLEALGYEAVPLRCSSEALRAIRKCDAVFNLAEGFESNIKAEPYVAGALELLALPYTGSPPEALELCRNKYLAKLLLEGEGIPTPRFQLFRSSLEPFNLGFPVIVKPAYEDASIGITANSVARNENELRGMIRWVIETYRQPALVEEYIKGREINASVLGNGEHAEVLPLSEIVFNLPEGMPRIMSFEAKWLESSCYYENTLPRCPTQVEPALEEEIERLALRACSALGVRDYARVDFRVRGEEVFVLEVNPNPCINPSSSGFVRSASVAGLDYSQVVKRIMDSALEREGYRGGGEDKIDQFTFENLIFKKVKAGDASLLARWFNDAEVSKYMDITLPCDAEQLVVYILSSADEGFMVYLDNRAIGFASIYNMNGCTGEVSYLIGEKEHRGRGLGKKIVKSLVVHGFTRLGLSSLFASSTVENHPSIRALESAGFRRIGTRRAYQRLGMLCLDEVLFDITRDDFLVQRTPSE